MNTAPDTVDELGLADGVAAFFTFGPGYSTGVYILTILGVLLMVGSIAAWMKTENTRLTVRAEKIRARMASAPSGTAGD